ncbi:MAG: FAD-dependent oxidoreductase [Metallosphaera yellowstonensis]|jgi:NADH dehydrogenase, FAD-containing subunit
MRVLVLGGGFAGLSSLAENREATVLDSKEYFLLTHRLADVIETGNPSIAAVPYSSKVLRTKVLKVNFKEKVVVTDKGSLSYDKLIISMGYEQDLRFGKSVQKLETLEDAISIRAKLTKAKRVAILGGGTLGVELAGVIQEMGKKVTLVEYQNRLLSFMSKESSDFAFSKLRGMGVEVMLGTKVEGVEEGKVITNRGEIGADLIIAAAGFRGPKIIEEWGLTNKNGRMLVDDHLRSIDFDDVYGAGDCMTTKSFVPMSAQVAVQSGRTAMLNAMGREEKFQYRQMAVILRVGREYFGDFMGKFVKGSLAEMAKRYGIYRAIKLVESV